MGGRGEGERTGEREGTSIYATPTHQRHAELAAQEKRIKLAILLRLSVARHDEVGDQAWRSRLSVCPGLFWLL